MSILLLVKMTGGFAGLPSFRRILGAVIHHTSPVGMMYFWEWRSERRLSFFPNLALGLLNVLYATRG